MLDLNPDTVCELIDIAHEFHTQDAVALPEAPPARQGEIAERLLEPYVEQSSFRAFEALIEDLDPDQQQQIVALLWLGRGDYTLDDWEEALREAAAAWTGETAAYLLAHPLLASHLSEGLELHGCRCD